jgi:hypothetical protein
MKYFGSIQRLVIGEAGLGPGVIIVGSDEGGQLRETPLCLASEAVTYKGRRF